MKSTTMTVSIDRPPIEVFTFILNPENFPQWLTFISGVHRSGDEWFLDTAEGAMRIRFVSENEFGILDHFVRLSDGSEILNPMRVVANGSGSEVMFTLFQLPQMSDQKFNEDANTVESDFRILKKVLEWQGDTE